MILPSSAAASGQQEVMENKENEELLLFAGRSPCDGSMSSIGSCPGVDTSSPKDVQQLCTTRRIITEILDDESATGLRIRSPAAASAPNEGLASSEGRVLSEARVKFLCSFGGRIMPRPSDSKLRYAGGETRIVSVNREVRYPEIMAKLCELCDQAIVLKYQMPDEDLDALVSVCNDEDLENMMEEYDRLELGDSRLRVFLFPGYLLNEDTEELERTEGGEAATLRTRSGYIFPSDMDCFGEPVEAGGNLEQQYIDAVNGVQDLSLRKDSGGAGNSGALDGSYPGESLEFSLASRVGASSISSAASPSALSPQMASWIASCSKQTVQCCPNEHQPGEFYAPGTPPEQQLKRSDFPSSSTMTTDQKADILQLYPAQQEGGETPRQQQQQQQHEDTPVHDEAVYGPHLSPYPSHFGPHLCHAVHIPSPTCFGYPQRCVCALPQFQLHFGGRPPAAYSGQPYGRPAVHGHCGVFHGSHPCCFEHPAAADGRSVWWTQFQQGCVHCDVHLQRQVLSKSPLLPQTDSGMPNTPTSSRCPGTASFPFGLHVHVDNSAQGVEFTDSPRGVSSPLASYGFVGKEPDCQSPTAQPDKELQAESSSRETERSPEPGEVLVVSSSVEMQTKVADAGHMNRQAEGITDEASSAQVSTLVLSTVSTRVVKSPAMKSLLSTSIHQASTSSSVVTSEPTQNKTLVAVKEETVVKSAVEEKEVIRSPTLQIWDKFAAELDGKEKDPPTQSAEGDGQDNTALRAEKEAVSRGLQTIRNCDLEEIRQLGSGTFGTVFYGKWRGSEVAIKRIKPSCFAGRPSERDRLVADFWREAYTLSQLHHPNVVAFYGVVPDGPDGTLATVTEYMVNGSLKQVLHRKDRTIDRRKRLLIAMDAAIGMEYLHEKKIVHFDLKCENLLVNMRDPHRPICKVGDFGLSKVKHRTMVSGGVRGTLPWMAPELLNGSCSMVTEKVDIYSFGIVMWELLTGEEPYANMHYGAIIGGIVSNTLRPPIPDWCDPAWKSLMERCWGADPAARPSFSSVAADLRAASPLQPKTQAC